MDLSVADLHLDLKRESIGERDSRRSSISEKPEQRPSSSKTRSPLVLADDEPEPIDLAPPSPPIPSFRKMLFPVEPVTATTVNFSPRLEMAALKKNREGRAAEEARQMSAPTSRTKTKYELFREKRYMKNYKSSLSDLQRKQEKNKTRSLRFNIGDSNLESNLTIAALNSEHFSIFEEQPESGEEIASTPNKDPADKKGVKDDVFDLQTFLDGLKKPKIAVKHLKASRVDELRARIEELGSVQDGLSKEECLYYIEAFVAIDKDESGAITDIELFEAMDTLNMEVTLEKVKEMIRTVDVNGDGDVSIDEFLKLMAGLRRKITFLQTNEQMQFAFDIVDRDHDGLIGLQDLMTLFEEIGEHEVDFNSCKKMLHAVTGESLSQHKSEDPKVNFAQFCKLVKAIGE